MKSYVFVVDVEADGPAPGLYSMVNFGCCLVEDSPGKNTFYGETAPISDKWIPEALSVSGFTREQHLKFNPPQETFEKFNIWLSRFNGRKIFLTDNLAFDWQFINYYFHAFIGENPFGFSGRRIGDMYSGLSKNFHMANNWKKFRETKHDHNPVNDAIGNAEAFLKMRNFGLKF